tara:strand:- start:1522 stop:1962 length:441 start_codon:yes stop_codon:yes gene_type:complete
MQLPLVLHLISASIDVIKDQMMALTIHKQFFKTRDEVYQDLARSGHWPTTYVSTASPELPVHWHDLDVSGYVISGKTYLLDEAGARHEILPGDKLEIPKGTLHAEGSVEEEVVYIVGTEFPGVLIDQLTLLDPKDQPKAATDSPEA